MRRTGSQIVWEMLLREGVEVVFGMPGGAIMATYHPLQDYGIRHVLMRHEQAAAHAADGYARVSGRVGVAIATSGPGATNLTTGIATAMMDSIPIVCITGQVCTSSIGSDAFQEADITGITLPITKHNYLVTHVEDLADVIHEAFYIARTGRPGPVLIDLPMDVQRAETEFVAPHGEPSLLGYRPDVSLDPTAIARASELIDGAESPVILAGHGVVLSRAFAELRAFAERGEIPVATTLLGKPAFPDWHPLSLGMMGMHGSAVANQAIQDADLLLAVGMRFDDRVTGCVERYAPRALKIQIDFDISEIGKNVPVDVAVHGDVRSALEALLERAQPAERPALRERIDAWRAEAGERDLLSHPDEERLVAPYVVQSIAAQTEGRAIVVTDVGQNQMWAAQYYSMSGAQAFVTSGGLGTMGFGLPAAIGAQIAAPGAEVWLIAGDGGFQMNVQELATLAQEALPVRMAVLNNGCLGMVRQWQEMFYDRRYESTILANPDFVRLAEAYGIPAWRAETPDESARAIEAARESSGPCLVEFRIVSEGEDGNVYPMVPSGAALHEMIRRPISVAAQQGRGRE
jgi:acetolactate synthase-1/2/3 large subunit